MLSLVGYQLMKALCWEGWSFIGWLLTNESIMLGGMILSLVGYQLMKALCWEG